jgi:MFS family permease
LLYVVLPIANILIANNLSQDAIGPVRFLIIEFWIFVIGNIVAGTSTGLYQLVAGRLIAGIGGAGILSMALVILSRESRFILQISVR